MQAAVFVTVTAADLCLECARTVGAPSRATSAPPQLLSLNAQGRVVRKEGGRRDGGGRRGGAEQKAANFVF